MYRHLQYGITELAEYYQEELKPYYLNLHELYNWVDDLYLVDRKKVGLFINTRSYGSRTDIVCKSYHGDYVILMYKKLYSQTVLYYSIPNILDITTDYNGLLLTTYYYT